MLFIRALLVLLPKLDIVHFAVHLSELERNLQQKCDESPPLAAAESLLRRNRISLTPLESVAQQWETHMHTRASCVP
jgi:hypothetical protein